MLKDLYSLDNNLDRFHPLL